MRGVEAATILVIGGITVLVVEGLIALALKNKAIVWIGVAAATVFLGLALLEIEQ